MAKRPRRVEPTYAEICGGTVASDYSERERSDSDGWYVAKRRRRKEKRRRPPESLSVGEKASGRGSGGAGKRILQGRRRKEAILIKVDEGREWMEIYRKIMAVRSTIVGTTGMRKTKAGHILIEFDGKVAVNEVADEAQSGSQRQMKVSALVERAIIQVKNIGPLTDKEGLVEVIRRDWGISPADQVEVRALRMAPWGTGKNGPDDSGGQTCNSALSVTCWDIQQQDVRWCALVAAYST